MGAIPAYQTIGAAAPLIFLLLRLVQGIFMGGMVAATHTLGTESIGPGHRGLASGVISGGGSGIGKLFASLVFVLVSLAIPGPDFAAWGWRIMFFSGLASSLLGLFVFTRLQESPLWLALAARKQSAPPPRGKRLDALRGGYAGVTFGCVLLTLAGGGLSYLTSGYLPTFLKIVNHMPSTELGVILSGSAVCVMAASVLSGAASDYLGRRRGMFLCGAVSLLCIPPLYLGLGQAHAVGAIAAYTVALSAIGTFCYAPLLIVLNERFPTEIRSTGTAVSWNIGFAIGGSMPTIVSLFTKDAGALPTTLATASALASLVYLTVVLFTPETKGKMG
jgi:MFS family permease